MAAGAAMTGQALIGRGLLGHGEREPSTSPARWLAVGIETLRADPGDPEVQVAVDAVDLHRRARRYERHRQDDADGQVRGEIGTATVA